MFNSQQTVHGRHEVKQVTDPEEWDAFVESSPQGTIFSTTKWLDIIDMTYTIWGVYSGGKLVGGAANFDSPAPITPFQGILVAPIEGKYTTVMSWHNKIAEALLPYLPSEFCCHYTYPDIRPFKWAEWITDIRYTYVLDLRDMKLAELNLEKQTRYEIKQGYRLAESSATDTIDFLSLYRGTFDRKGLVPAATVDHIMRIYCELDSHLYMSQDGESAMVMIRDSKRSYYILGASTGHGSARCLWEAIQSEARLRPEVDLVGCNNPLIGQFKKGFGGKLRPYYCIRRS